jgi:hypothetical protein
MMAYFLLGRNWNIERSNIMGFLDWLFGRKKAHEPQQPSWSGRGEQYSQTSEPLTDEQAIQRYRYMLRTAPPETIEQAHAEAFAQLTPAQRAQVLRELTTTLPAHERAAIASGQDDPKTLARVATRAEMRQPGTLERTFGGMGGMGMMGGGMFGGSFLTSLAGAFVGSMIAQQFFGGLDSAYGAGDYGAENLDQGAEADPGYDDSGYDSGGDFGGDFGADFGGEI